MRSDAWLEVVSAYGKIGAAVLLICTVVMLASVAIMLAHLALA